MNTKKYRLVTLLKHASALLKEQKSLSVKCLFNDVLETLANIIAAAADKILKNDMSDLIVLWKIFAPTSDWDDVNENLELGDQIFSLLNDFLKEID